MSASSRTAQSRQANFKFRRGITVGSVVAETDRTFLADAFLDTGVLSILRDTDNPKSVIVGRTGAGKTALLLKLEASGARVIRVHPDALSLRYLSNSTIIPYLTKIGVRLDPFYQLLWRHVLVMELIRTHYKLDSEDEGRNFLQRVANFIDRKTNAKKKRALEYYAEWNPNFWRDADVRVKDITDRLGEKVTSALGSEIGAGAAKVSAKIGSDVSSETTVSREIIDRAQKVVDDVSLRAIYDGMEIVREDVLSDSQKQYFVLIDDLDKNWVEIGYAYDLIDALLDAVAEFAAIPNVKIVVALRTNIVEALHARREKQRQQREKHRNLFLDLRWTRGQLVEMMNERLEKHVRGSYGGVLDFQHLLPPPRRRSNVEAVDYMLDRTFNRPRDLIGFVNECLTGAAEGDRKHVSWQIINNAERRYSQTRLEAIEDEWFDNYTGIHQALLVLRGVPAQFQIVDLSDSRLDALLAEGKELDDQGVRDSASLPLNCYWIFEREMQYEVVWRLLIPIYYRIGAIGIKVAADHPVRYVEDAPTFPADLLTTETRLVVHPALHMALGITNSVQDYSSARTSS